MAVAAAARSSPAGKCSDRIWSSSPGRTSLRRNQLGNSRPGGVGEFSIEELEDAVAWRVNGPRVVIPSGLGLSRYRSPAPVYALGPRPLSSMMKALIGANVAMFLLVSIVSRFRCGSGSFTTVIRSFYLTTVTSCSFAGIFHLLFNMLVLWMIGTELERMWMLTSSSSIS